MKTKPIGIILIVICTLFLSAGQLLFKFAASKFSLNVLELISNRYLIFGLVVYAICALLALLALKNGELSVIFPLIPLSFIWVGLLSYFILAEPFTIVKILGFFAILIGAFMVGYGGRI